MFNKLGGFLLVCLFVPQQLNANLQQDPSSPKVIKPTVRAHAKPKRHKHRLKPRHRKWYYLWISGAIAITVVTLGLLAYLCWPKKPKKDWLLELPDPYTEGDDPEMLPNPPDAFVI